MLNPVIGEMGRLVEVRFTATENVSRTERYAEEFTIEGRRRVQLRPHAPRSWGVSVPIGGSEDIAVLAEFFSGGWGNGPWQWVPVAAQVGNMLTPEESMLVDFRTIGSYLEPAGPTRASDGSFVGRSLAVDLSSGWVGVNGRDIPIIPGREVTWAADVEGSGPQLTMSFFNEAGATTGLHSSNSGGSGMTRVSVTATPPPGSVYASVGVRSSVTRITRPQVTWTPGPVSWSAGHGCGMVVLEGLSEELLTVDHTGPQSSASFTILEVS